MPKDSSTNTPDLSWPKPETCELRVTTRDTHISSVIPLVARVLPDSRLPSELCYHRRQDYNDAIEVEPLLPPGHGDEDDIAIEQALQNARTNSEITTYKAVQREAVKDTLSRFGSGPRKPVAATLEQSKAQKPTLDVDAFKRLLLTGETESQPQITPSLAQSTSDTSSSADTASLSRRSILENLPQTIEETPRSSIEQDRSHDSSAYQEGRRKPPPPKSRHGKRIKQITEDPNLVPTSMLQSDSISAIPPSQAPTHSVQVTDSVSQPLGGLDPSDVKKRPPTPPLSRRKSTKQPTSRPSLGRSPSSRTSISSIAEAEASQASGSATPSKMAPPPPPLRRIDSHSSRKASAELPTTMEEGEDDSASISQFPQLSKRISLGAPPLPPPRRNRGSSRTSVDSQRPSLGQLGLTGSARASGEYRRPSDASFENASKSDNRSVPDATNAMDILADLAALQREGDAARRSGE